MLLGNPGAATGFAFLAGFVLDRLQRIPASGEMLRHDGWLLEVVEMDRRRIATLRLHEPWESVQSRLRASRGATL